ncbi:MAG: tetratricopeptide repeat protein, partial [Proteobacteria bacterium]|nr:tetratricopeptide repeat protein [Pseudomonadota bacterium]
DHYDALHLLGVLRLQNGAPQEAVTLITRAIRVGEVGGVREVGGQDAAAQSNLGLAYRALGQHSQALIALDAAVVLNPDYVDALNNRGAVLEDLERPEEALESYNQAAAADPQHPTAHYNRGGAFRKLDRLEEALAAYDKTLALNPDNPAALCNRGAVLRGLDRLEEALASYDQALDIDPGNAGAHYNSANALRALGRLDEAVLRYDRALEIAPDHAEAWISRGTTLQHQFRVSAAEDSFRRALDVEPDNFNALIGHGNALNTLKRSADALVCFEKALGIKPETEFLFGHWLHTKQLLCDWDGLEGAFADLGAKVDAGENASTPFPLLATPLSAAQQRSATERYAERAYPAAEEPVWKGEKYRHDKIRIGYFSADFHLHPVAQLSAELFESHDRSHFEISAYSCGPPSDDPMRRRLTAAFDRFVDLFDATDRAIAERARDDEIDIAVDLGGYTQGARNGIFAQRPAPVQAAYLGYASTMGARYMDYLIADAIVTPEDHRAFYTEKIVSLPECFQVNDSQKVISTLPLTRKHLGLPEAGFVFCAFNNSYKISPETFYIWLRLLHMLDDSVLWLSDAPEPVKVNLAHEAEQFGVDPARLIFAPRFDALHNHLARFRAADLFLDTFPYNAHATASDALWAGLPVLMRAGETYASRVSASLLTAIGLTELITGSVAEYEARALDLAATPAKVAVLKEKLAVNRTTHPLFNTARFTCHLEDAFTEMHRRAESGLAPDHISLSARD